MEIWQLNTFRVVSKNLHFTRASEELGLTQSAVSYQITSLEEELGVKLFNRNKRKISLTPQGKTVLDYANKMLYQVDTLKREIEDNREKLEGIVTISAITRSLEHQFLEIRDEFRKSFPYIEVYFNDCLDAGSVIKQVKTGNSDVGLVASHNDSDGLLEIPCGRCNLLLVVGKEHRLAKRKKVKVEDLKDEKWFLFEKESGLRKPIDELLITNNLIPKNQYVTNDGSLIRNLVIKGEGIGFLPDCTIHNPLTKQHLVIVALDGVELPIYLTLVVTPDRNKITSVFVNYLLDKKIEGIYHQIK